MLASPNCVQRKYDAQRLREKRGDGSAKAKEAQARAEPVINVTGSEGSKPAGSGHGPAEHSKTVSESGSERILDLQKLDLRKLVEGAGTEMLLGLSAEDMEKKFMKMQEKGQLGPFLDARDNAAWKKKA